MAKDYTIIEQTQTVDLAPGGRFIDVVAITFQTKDGDIGTVRVPVSEIGTENVAQVVGARAAMMIAIRAL